MNGGVIMHDINDVADFFLYKSAMSPKKLQKLLYYAYAWTLAILNDNVDDLHTRLFNNRIEAWVHGAVIPEIYEKYKQYGWSDIPKKDSFNKAVFSEDEIDVLNQVWDVYGIYSGNQLEEICHKETPWIEARNGLPPYASSNQTISDKTMFIYYNKQADDE